MQSTLCEMPGWMKLKLESRLLGEISTTSDINATLMAESEEGLKSLLIKVKDESEKASFKLNIKKNHGIQSWASLVAQLVKNPLAMRETWVGSLGWEDPLGKGKATHSNILVWRIPLTV